MSKGVLLDGGCFGMGAHICCGMGGPRGGDLSGLFLEEVVWEEGCIILVVRGRRVSRNGWGEKWGFS